MHDSTSVPAISVFNLDGSHWRQLPGRMDSFSASLPLVNGGNCCAWRCLTGSWHVRGCYFSYRCHPRAGLVCGSGCKEWSPENLLEAPPLSGSQEGAPSRGWEVSGDPEALDPAALGPSGPVFGIPTQLSQSVLTGSDWWDSTAALYRG